MRAEHPEVLFWYVLVGAVLFACLERWRWHTANAEMRKNHSQWVSAAGPLVICWPVAIAGLAAVWLWFFIDEKRRGIR